MDKDRGQRMKIEPTLTTITASSTSHEMEVDPVNKPQHYNQSDIECIDAIEAMTKNMSGAIAPHAANVLKYMWRCEYKNGQEDVDKMVWYALRFQKRFREMRK